MGSNDNLAGVITGVGEIESNEVRGSGLRSDRSKSRKPSRGAPPSSLSQPLPTDRSRSSSPDKADRNPSLPTKPSLSSSNVRLQRTPFSKHSTSNDQGLEDQRSTVSIQWGRLGGKGRAVAFQHHHLLPRATTSSTPSTTSFQPQVSTPDTQQRPSSSYRAFEFKTSTPISPTTNANVFGEILPPSFLSQQSNVPSLPTTEEPPLTKIPSNDDTNMSSTTELTSTRTFHPGSERGYDSSPMARLIQQYKEDSNDEDTSTWQRVVTLSTKKSLLASDIIKKRGIQSSYTLHPTLLEEVTRVVAEVQVFLERTSALIPERTSHFIVDPRDTFLSILKESSDLGQIHAAWMGLTRRLSLAQENLVKYETQYKGPIEGENLELPMSPISTDIGIYEAIEGEEDRDFRMRYMYENVPHHQDQIRSPRKLRDGTSWSSIISLPNNAQDTTSSTLPTIPEQGYAADDSEAVTMRRDKGKRRITDEFVSPPTSPRIVNIRYGTPFKSSSQFFVRLGIPLPPPETLTQKNVLVGLALPQTPAFEDILNSRVSEAQNVQKPLQSRASNPFEGRDTPPHMNARFAEQNNNAAYLPPSSTNRQTPAQTNTEMLGSTNNDQSRRGQASRSERGSSAERAPPARRGGQRGHPGGDPDDDDDGSSDGQSQRGNNPPNREPPNRNRPSFPSGGGGGGGNPGGGGGGGGPNGGGYQSINSGPQNNIPYGNLVATILNELKQEHLPIWDRNKDTAIEYFWKIQQLAALEGDIPVALGFWLWKSLKENSKIWMWFTTLPFSEQAKMRTHYLHYLKGIKDNYLGRSWQISMNRKYENQSFRQEGFERESPPAFIVRRIMYTRMLVASDDGGPMEVYLVMQKAPISWGPILNLETIRSTSLLYLRATDHELALVHAAKYESSNVVTSDNLLYTLRKLGIQLDRNRPFERSAKLVTSKDTKSEREEEIIHEAFLGQLSREECTYKISSNPEVMKEALQVLKKRQRPPPERRLSVQQKRPRNH